MVGGVPVGAAAPDVQGALPRGTDANGPEYVGVFLPCAPNPTTGFFFYLPRADIIEVGISVDDAAKLVMSAGVIQPEDPQTRLQAMAAGLRAAQVGAIPSPSARTREPLTETRRVGGSRGSAWAAPQEALAEASTGTLVVTGATGPALIQPVAVSTARSSPRATQSALAAIQSGRLA